ncbi:hypothetical protein B7494_g4296 [Chlorociboria aeruginascens]|nr:hypothetical protein B7494_g4296 [Chlorociboria aeruginascens]
MCKSANSGRRDSSSTHRIRQSGMYDSISHLSSLLMMHPRLSPVLVRHAVLHARGCEDSGSGRIRRYDQHRRLCWIGKLRLILPQNGASRSESERRRGEERRREEREIPRWCRGINPLPQYHDCPPTARSFDLASLLLLLPPLLSLSLSLSLSTMTIPHTSQPPAHHASRLESQPTASTASAAELASTKISLRAALRQFPDFPIPGIDFVDILPLFAAPALHGSLIRALELQVLELDHGRRPDVIVGLDARGFLFGPSLALRLGAGFAPVRKRGKLPGPTEEAAFEKEYGQDFFQIQRDAVKPGQRVLVVDDIIATGGSACAAGELVEKLGGTLVGYLFILELDFLKGRDKLSAPVHTLLRDDMGGTT